MEQGSWVLRVMIVAVVSAIVVELLHAYLDKQGMKRTPL